MAVFNHNLRCVHINLQHCRSANLALSQVLMEQQLNLAFVNEPYFYKEGIVGFPMSMKIVAVKDSPKAGIIINSNVDYVVLKQKSYFVAIKLEGNDEVICISFYSPPSSNLEEDLMELEAFLVEYSSFSFVIAGDFNAKSSAWGPRPTDSRGSKVLSMVNNFDLVIINEEDSPPTFDGVMGIGWIDLLMIRNMSEDSISNWEISDLPTLSDHRYMFFELSYKKDSECPGNRWSIDKLYWMEFQVDVKKLIERFRIDDNENIDMNEFIKDFEKELIRICNKNKKRYGI